MSKLIAMLVVLAPTLAHADKVIKSGTHGTWDCGVDPVIHFALDHAHYTFKGTCTEFHLDGSGNVLAFEKVTNLHVNGGNNKISGAADTVHVNIVGTKLTLSGSVGQVHLNGHDNVLTVDHVGNLHVNGNDNTVRASGAVDEVHVNIQKSGFTFTGTCAAFHVNGDGNKLKLDHVGALHVNDAHNDIHVTAAKLIQLNASSNKVTYAHGTPEIHDRGHDNTITGPSRPRTK